MQLGVVFPQTEIGSDVGAVRAFAQGVEGLGFRHLLVYDHVVGADPEVHKPWTGPYDVKTTFHEPMVLFGFLAAATTLELATAVLIAPQRQTALIAKQATEVDLLAEGRFRLGVAVGWNEVEYDALGMNFSNRGKRLDEQVVLLRKLWTEQSVSFSGDYEHVSGAGLSPLPIQRPIPIWFGAHSAPAFRRAGRLGDGWFPEMEPGPELEAALAIVESAAIGAGRDPSEILMEGRMKWRPELSDNVAVVESWSAAGASHLAINTMSAGFESVEDHLHALGQISSELDLC
jgi:probable F420-dependent oxidoreductase